MKFFFDCEFIEDGKTIDLISIGMVSEDGRRLHLCNQEAQLHLAGPWVREHVLPKLPPYGAFHWRTRAQIRDAIHFFVSPDVDGERERPEFWAYYADYDWVALCQLFGTMMKLPSHWPRFCMDLRQWAVQLGVKEKPPTPEREHDALEDALWNMKYHQLLSEHARARALVAPSPVVETVDHPPHYTSHPSGVECVDVNEHFPSNVGAAIKYLWRKDQKHPVPLDDLKKAAWYLRREARRCGYSPAEQRDTIAKVIRSDSGSLLSDVLGRLRLRASEPGSPELVECLAQVEHEIARREARS